MLGCGQELCGPRRILGSMLSFGQMQRMFLSPLSMESTLDE